MGKRNSGGWHLPAVVVCSVLLALERTCTLLLRNHCSELPLSQRASGSCRKAALLGVLPAQNPGGMVNPGHVTLVLTCFTRD